MYGIAKWIYCGEFLFAKNVCSGSSYNYITGNERKIDSFTKVYTIYNSARICTSRFLQSVATLEKVTANKNKCLFLRQSLYDNNGRCTDVTALSRIYICMCIHMCVYIYMYFLLCMHTVLCDFSLCIKHTHYPTLCTPWVYLFSEQLGCICILVWYFAYIYIIYTYIYIYIYIYSVV
jgi:hypothetical protein